MLMREFVNSLDNERIKQLAEQAGAGWDHKYHWYVGSETMQKFAELIVGECVEVCNSVAKDRASYHDREGRDTAYSCGDEIKEHFGVE